MAVLAMNRISICGLKEDRQQVLNIIQRLGCIEIQEFIDEDDVFKKTRLPISASEFERNIHDAETALEVLTQYGSGKAPGMISGMLSSFNGREVVPVEKFDNFIKDYAKVSGTIDRILQLQKSIAEKKAEIVKCSQQIEMLEPWRSLDIGLDFNGTDRTAAFVGALPGAKNMDEIYEALADFMPVDVNVISSTKDQTCVMVICGKEAKDGVNSALRGMGFSYPPVNSKLTPVQEEERLKECIKTLETEIDTDSKEIVSYEPMRDDIKFLADYQTIRSEKFAVASRMPQSEHTFMITGFTPEKYVPKIEKSLSKYDVFIETSKPEKDDDVPVLLKNNGYSSTVQGVVEAYALPKKGEIDPTFLISLFYYILFGFMLSDAAIGFVLFIGCLVILLKHKNIEINMKRNVTLFMIGGLSAVFWGVLFGSYFGDMPTVVAREFFGVEFTIKPIWIDMQASPMTVLTVALGIGILHIFVGMGVGGYQMLKNKDIVGFIFDIIAWYVILVGLIVKMFSMEMIMNLLFAGRDPFFSAQVGNIGLYAAGVAAIAVLIMGGRESKNPAKRLMKGAYAIYGITSYLSDVLSYARLLALGLATGVISSVANMIGTMFGTGVVKVIVYILVFIILNGINMFINIMGAYVHTNRLQYVEFYSRFFEGGGRAFEPYSVKTKYYKFKED